MTAPDARGRPPGRPDSRPQSIATAAPATGPTSGAIVRHAADGARAATPRRCPACGHDPVGDVLDAQDAAWRAGYRAGTEWVADVRLGAFCDGWRAGLQAGAERGTAA